MLIVRREQQDVVARDSFRRRLVNHSRGIAASLCPDVSDAALISIIDRAISTGGEIGITTERELAKWALVALLSRGSAFDQEDLKKHIQSFGRNDQTKMDRLLDDLAAAIEQQA